ncbi:hypothetical protein FRX31_028688 [Thalictrum thalictroides]|uniref:Uncharacterized protein n=1 Tax=Thalictrum thalictroides TaxID=46969 RepID=A0A7J6V9S6_THATH|nr:hypothetical protein FRX31_028688 [Thalictrum thalictroides]
MAVLQPLPCDIAYLKFAFCHCVEGEVDLFCTLMNLFPSSVHRHYNNVESAIVSKIMSGKCYSNLSKKLEVVRQWNSWFLQEKSHLLH